MVKTVVEIKFDPNCEFPSNMTQEDLDKLVEEIKKMAEEGTLMENSEEVDLDKLQEENPDLYKLLINIGKNDIQAN